MMTPVERGTIPDEREGVVDDGYAEKMICNQNKRFMKSGETLYEGCFFQRPPFDSGTHVVSPRDRQ